MNMEMIPVKIDMSRYVRTGAGANGASYDSLDNPLEMVKMYNTEYPTQPIYDELEVAVKVYNLGIPSPKPGELVTDGERIGIRFEKIPGKRSFSRILADEPGRVAEIAVLFAQKAKIIHSTVCPEGIFPDAKAQFIDILGKLNDFTPEEKVRIRAFIEAIPDCRTALHGDLHFGNIITTLPKGAPLDSPHDDFFIDLGYFSVGCPLLDIGMMLSICFFSSEEFRQAEMHVDSKLTAEFWKHFADEYFFSQDLIGERWFGPGISPDNIIEALKPYYCIKSLLIGYNIGAMLPESMQMFRETILK